jgi:hypothetical protein
METNIDYEAEVRKVYPDAVYWFRNDWYLILPNSETYSTLGGGFIEKDAWESAYNNLKKQNKL